MFVPFLYELRKRKVPVGATEAVNLAKALSAGVHDSSLDGFYHLCRTLCVKDIALYDAYDEAFLAYFKDVHVNSLELTKQLQEWMMDPKLLEQLTAEQREMLQDLDLDALRKKFEERLKQQKERHDGGNRWIGTGGTSPFGTNGKNPTGMRVGGGGGRSAMAVAGERLFKEYRRDIVLDVRQIDVALRNLRRLGREGAIEELDLDETIDKTGKNAGELEVVFRPPRRNRVKVILMMDVGGSMDPHSELMSRMFTAAARSGRFAKFRSYYFHNCVYNSVYEDAAFRKPVAVADILANSDRDEKLVVIGDALMHPAELLDPGGSMYLYSQTRASGIEWLRRLGAHFRSSAWLNPEPDRFWNGTTIEVVASAIPMWPLTMDGLNLAVRYLVRGGERPKIGDPSKWIKGMAGY